MSDHPTRKRVRQPVEPNDDAGPVAILLSAIQRPVSWRAEQARLATNGLTGAELPTVAGAPGQA